MSKRQAKPNPGKEYKEAIVLGARVRSVVTQTRGNLVPRSYEGTVSVVEKTRYAVRTERIGVIWLAFPKAKDVLFREGAFEYEVPGVSRVRVEVLKDERITTEDSREASVYGFDVSDDLRGDWE